MLKIAEKWYERKKISHELTLIYEPHVHPFLRCNIWHLRGRDKDLIIDTGLGVASLRAEIADLIDKPVSALATHIHYDHVGCLHEFDDRLMHKIEAPRMPNYDEFCWLKLTDFPDDYQSALRVGDFHDYLIDAVPEKGFNIDGYQVTPTTVTHTLEEGDVIDLGNLSLEVFHLPGHSPGSLGLWEKQTGTLFSGDALYDGQLLDELPDSDIPDYIDTMKRLRALPVQTVHGGHEASFNRERMIELIDDYLAWRESA